MENIPKKLCGHSASHQHLSDPPRWLQDFVALLMCFSAFKLWSLTVLENRTHTKDAENLHQIAKICELGP